MTAADRDRRQRVRLEAAERFARGQSSGAAAALLRMTVRSVERWRQAWESGGVDVLRSRGPGARCRLDDGQLTRLEAELDRGPGVHGWADQRWILARIREMTICLFGVEDPVPGVWLLLCRRGWSCQMPARRAVERDDGAVEVWRKEVWSRAKNRRDHRWGVCFEDEAGQSLRPPRASSWGDAGRPR